MAEEAPKGKRRRFTGAGEPVRGRTKAKVGDTIRIERRNQWGIPPHSWGDVIEIVRVKHGEYNRYTTWWYRILFKRGGEKWITASHNWEVKTKHFVAS